MARIFISHASADRVVADEVLGWLRSEGHEPFLCHDVRDGVSVGEDWKERLYRELREVDAVIGVVTSSFVASSWCSAEVGIADARGCRLMPLCAEAGVVHPLMQKLLYVDYHSDPQQARDRVLQTVRELDDGSGAWREGDNPYPGLEPFTAAQSRVFFGRTAAAREVGNRLRAMGSTGGIVAVVGASGCGKSSLLHAAVVPLLHSDRAWLTVPPLVPGTDPLPELARALAAAAARLGLRWLAGDVRSRLEAGTDGLRRVADDLLTAGTGPQPQRLLLTIDQAEELFTRTTPAAKARFGQLLSDALTGPVQVVVAMRSAFLDDLRALAELAGTRIEAYTLAPLDREVLRDVIEQPAKVARLSLDDDLAATLVTDTGGGEALPLLAFTLRQLADGLPAGGRLSLSHYRSLGGVQDVLARHADATLAEAVRTSALTDREVLAGLTRLVTVDETGRRSRRRIRLDDLAEPLRVALQVFVDRRLLVSNKDDGKVWLTVAHEALLTGWRPLDTATADITIALRTARTVEQAAADWDSAGRPEHYLWDAKRLTATRTSLGMAEDSSRNLAAPPVVELDTEAMAFLDATARRVDAQQQRERRRRTRTITVLSILLVLALIGAGVAVYQQHIASDSQHIAIARSMVAEADRVRDQDFRRALQLGVAANRFDSGPRTRANLRQTLTSTTHFRTLRGHTRAVYGVAVTPDGRTLATTSGDATVRLWDISDRDRPEQLGEPLTVGKQAANGAAFSPDGLTMATAHGDSTVVLWDVSNRAQPKQLGQPLANHRRQDDQGWVLATAFSPDGLMLATASKDKTAILWDITDREHPRQLGQPLTSNTGEVNGVAFSSDKRTLLTASDAVSLWDISDRERPRQLGQPLSNETAASFSPDGRTLATAHYDDTVTPSENTIRLWDVNDRERPKQLGQPLVGHTGAIDELAFSPDGQIIASTSADNTVRLWDLTDRDQPRQLGQPLTGHTGAALKLAFTPDGHTLATASLDQTAILWDITDRSQPRRFRQPLHHTGAVNAIAVSPDSRTLVSADGYQNITLWDIADRDRPRQLGQPLANQQGGVFAVAFAPDGNTMATGGHDSTIKLWDVTDRDRPRQLGPPLTGHSKAVNGVAFAPDGHVLASTGNDQDIILWDINDRERPRQLGKPIQTGHIQEVYNLTFSPDGHTLATASLDQTVRLWDLSDRNQPHQLGSQLSGHRDAVRAVVFTPDGQTLITAGDDHMIILWDLSDRNRPRQLGQPLTGHKSAVNAIALAPNGRILATASDDQTVMLWDLSDRAWPHRLDLPLAGHAGGVTEMTFASDNHTLASADTTGTVILWDVPSPDGFPGGDVLEACARAGGPVDEATWQQFAPGFGYEDTCAGR